MKKKMLLFALYSLLVVGIISYGAYYVINYTNVDTYSFENDGYTVLLKGNDTSTTYTFNKGDKYSYRKYVSQIGFNSSDGKSAAVSDDSVLHYSNGSLMTLKNTVGINLKNVSNKIIFYYNIYKNTLISQSDEAYSIDTVNNERVDFDQLLLRINATKFLLAGDSIRLLLPNEEIIEFGDYVYFEYFDGSIVKVYNDKRYYQTISKDAKIVVGDVTIDLAKETISKEAVEYISLTNLIIDYAGNIDVITKPEEAKNEEITENDINKTKIEQPKPDSGTTSTNNSSIVGGGDGDGNEEEVDEDLIEKGPEIKVTQMNLTALKLEAKLEVIDDDGTLNGNVTVAVIDNVTGKNVYQDTFADMNIMFSIANLTPDKEYTLTASAPYRLNGVDYDKTFVNKIFRTKSLGVTLDKDYSDTNEVYVKLTKDSYSTVSAAVVKLRNSAGVLVDEKSVSFDSVGDYQVSFDGLTSNTNYTVSLEDILVDGIAVESGFNQTLSVMTLKKAPTIGELKYITSARNSTFTLLADEVKDTENGIRNYRYEVYDARNYEASSTPLVTINREDLKEAVVTVDGEKIMRWVPYTYKLIIEFYDNEKIVEYEKDLGSNMELDGSPFPTLRFDSTYVTWEQINGVIAIEDPEHTLVSNEFEVVYKNSIDLYDIQKITVTDGETQTDYSVNGEVHHMTVPAGAIPVSINGLRKHETYTFQVYGYLNLHENGDESLDTGKVYIGSVFVQTGDPQTLLGSFAPEENGATAAFAVNFKLVNDDAAFEASTLNDLTFYLFEGTQAIGTPFAQTHVQDLNSAPYISTIKRDYYDNSILLTPAFFGLENSDLVTKKYTILVGDGKDYTKYKNEIPIANNEMIVDINDVINEFPDDFDDAILIKTIQNRNASSFGINNDDNLEPNTVVGYTLVAKYANRDKNAVSVTYHVKGFNPETEQWEYLPWLDRTQNYNENGTLPQIIYEVDHGTSGTSLDKDVHDTKLRRGNSYRIEFEVTVRDLETNQVSVYPRDLDNTIILQSTILSPVKQHSTITMYPSSSTADSVTWKYKIKDIDEALSPLELCSYVGANLTRSNGVASSCQQIAYSNQFQSVTFTGLQQNQNYGIKKQDRLLKSSPATSMILNRQWHYTHTTSLPLEYTVTADDNRLSISLYDYYNKRELANKISYVDLVIAPQSGSLEPVRLEKQKLTDGNLYIDYIGIKQFKGIDLNISMTAYYDSGAYGFDLTSEYKALQVQSIEGPGNYLHGFSYRLESSQALFGSLYQIEFNPIQGILSLSDEDMEKDYAVTVDEGGVMLDNNYINPKELSPTLLTNRTGSVRFDEILPSISLLNPTTLKYNISSLLRSAEIRADLTVPQGSQVYENKIYIELWKTDENGSNAELVQRTGDGTYNNYLVFNVSDFANPILIEDLLPKTNYYIKFFLYKNDEDKQNDVRQYLYDVDSHASGLIYRFYTLTSVGISNMNLQFVAVSYENKNLVLSYTVDVVHGYDTIEYTFMKLVNGEWIPLNLEIPTSISFSPMMTVITPAPPTDSSDNLRVTWGDTIKVYATPVAYYEENGERVPFRFDTVNKEFVLKKGESPFVGITSYKTSDSLRFRVTINDPSHMLYNDEYEIYLMDAQNNVIASSTSISTDVASRLFTFNAEEYNLVDGATYTLRVQALRDRFNTANLDKMDVIANQISAQYGDAISPGTVSATQNAISEMAIDVIFANSYRLTDVTSVEYYITNLNNGDFVTSGTDLEFNQGNLKYNSANNTYTYTIFCGNTTGLRADETYTITMNFYSGDTLVAQTETAYYYRG